MNYVDLVVFFVSIYFILLGGFRGFIRSLLGPFSVIVATYLSVVYYQHTNNLIVSLVIGLIGPLFLQFCLKYIISLWSKSVDTGTELNLLSRLSGAVLTLAWGWVFIAFTLILLAVLPRMGTALTQVHHQVVHSRSYAFVRPWGDIFFTGALQNGKSATNSNTDNDAQSLAQDPRFRKVLQDPEVQQEIKDHDIVKLMSNPKIVDLTKELMSDPAAFKKVMAIYNSRF